MNIFPKLCSLNLRRVFCVVVFADLGVGRVLCHLLLLWEILSALGIGTRDEVSNRNYINRENNSIQVEGEKAASHQTRKVILLPTANSLYLRPSGGHAL